MPNHRAVLKVGQNERIIQLLLGSGTNKVGKSNHDIQLIVDFFTHQRYMFIEVPKAKSVLSTTAADRNIAMLIHTLTRNNVS